MNPHALFYIAFVFVVGYNDLILIPAGAMSIMFEEVRPGKNYLGK